VHATTPHPRKNRDQTASTNAASEKEEGSLKKSLKKKKRVQIAVQEEDEDEDEEEESGGEEQRDSMKESRTAVRNRQPTPFKSAKGLPSSSEEGNDEEEEEVVKSVVISALCNLNEFFLLQDNDDDEASDSNKHIYFASPDQKQQHVSPRGAGDFGEMVSPLVQVKTCLTALFDSTHRTLSALSPVLSPQDAHERQPALRLEAEEAGLAQNGGSTR
jgi:hypothetical protein